LFLKNVDVLAIDRTSMRRRTR